MLLELQQTGRIEDADRPIARFNERSGFQPTNGALNGRRGKSQKASEVSLRLLDPPVVIRLVRFGQISQSSCKPLGGSIGQSLGEKRLSEISHVVQLREKLRV
jgi:hypothetical protein